MSLWKISVCLVGVMLLPLADVKHSLAQDQKKPEKSKEEKELISKCKSRLIKNVPPPEPKNWLWGKGETYRGGPVISYLIEEDGRVTNVKLKRSSGVRKIDEYEMEWVKGLKYQAMPGCPGVETTEAINIDFR